MQIFIARPDKSHGPYSLAEVNAYLASGHLTAQDMAWFVGCAGWMPLPQVPGVQMPPGSASPPAPPSFAPAFAPHPQVVPQQVMPQQMVPPGYGAPQFAGPEAERTLFEISPTLTRDVALTLLTCGLWLLVLVPKALVNSNCKYKLTSQRLLVTTGVASRHVEEIELYRVKDVTVNQGLMGRLLGFGTVVVHGNDATAPRIQLDPVNNPVKVKEQIRDAARACRRVEGVRAVEYGSAG